MPFLQHSLKAETNVFLDDKEIAIIRSPLRVVLRSIESCIITHDRNWDTQLNTQILRI